MSTECEKDECPKSFTFGIDFDKCGNFYKHGSNYRYRNNIVEDDYEFFICVKCLQYYDCDANKYIKEAVYYSIKDCILNDKNDDTTIEKATLALKK